MTIMEGRSKMESFNTQQRFNYNAMPRVLHNTLQNHTAEPTWERFPNVSALAR